MKITFIEHMQGCNVGYTYRYYTMQVKWFFSMFSLHRQKDF